MSAKSKRILEKAKLKKEVEDLTYSRQTESSKRKQHKGH